MNTLRPENGVGRAPVARLRARVHRVLCACPRLYAALLRMTGRGSVEKRALLACVRRGFTVVDVGANVGLYTELLSDIVGRWGAVHAFEPVPKSFAEMNRRLAGEPRRSNVRTVNAALGEVEGETEIIVPGEDHGQASLREHQAGSWASTRARKTERCPIMTLDACCRDFPRLDFVKIDVEGAELLVLRGGRTTLSRHRPSILVEVWREWTRAFGFAPEDVLEELARLGYDTVLGVDDGFVPLAEVDFTRPANLFCCRGDMPHGIPWVAR